MSRNRCNRYNVIKNGPEFFDAPGRFVSFFIIFKVVNDEFI